MSKSSARAAIRLHGVRHNNLKNFDLDLPLNQLIVITGLSGSGKSSLAFDTLFAEGQRRYIETFSPYARQFFDRMDKPQVDSIEGIPPAIAIEQRNAVKTTRSTVGTMTEICDYMKVLWPHLAQLHCRNCGRPVRKDAPGQIFQTISREVPKGANNHGEAAAQEILITFEVPLSEKLPLDESLALIAKQGYQRLLLSGKIVRLDELASRAGSMATLTVLQDRLKLGAPNRARFVEACEQAYHFGKGVLTIHHFGRDANGPQPNGLARKFSNRFHCAECDIEYREPSPALFSFNHPVGACPTCKGFGRVISIDYELAIPDRSRTIAEGVVKPWLSGQGVECHRDLLRMCRHFEIPIDVPFSKLPSKWQRFVIEGEPGYGKDEEHEWPRAWYGVKGYFRWLESRAYKMHVRVLLSRYRSYTTCPACVGARLQPDALLYRLTLEGSDSPLTLAQFYALPVRNERALIETLAKRFKLAKNDAVALALSEVRSRLGYLDEVGLGYLTLDRPTRSLSGGETERVNLTTCLGTRLVNTLFVLDEPSVGLHPRDTERLVRILEYLRNAGNTVVVVEHEPTVMRAADQIVDLGPGHGAAGGHVVFQGSFSELLRSADSLTGQYLSGALQIEIPRRRPVRLGEKVRTTASRTHSAPHPRYALNNAPGSFESNSTPSLQLTHASRHNLQDINVGIPLGRFVCVTGVSGSGKTTLIREVLLPALENKLKAQSLNRLSTKASDRFESNSSETGSGNEADDEQTESGGNNSTVALSGHEWISRTILVDQSILGKTPRSNPAVYIGAFDHIRDLFARSPDAKQRGLNASAFSFNSAQGQCERCRGAGFEKIEMQFLSDVFIRCPDCDGRRYRKHILETKIESSPKSRVAADSRLIWSIADILDATVDEAIEFLSGVEETGPAAGALEALTLLQEVGLGYLRLGQPINTLSGGESQRLKLVRHLADAAIESHNASVKRANGSFPSPNSRSPAQGVQPTLFLFDEPTTGLHFEDVRILIKVFQRLVDAGHSVVVIEHNLDLIKSADWLIDLGPGAGDEGGRIVAQGTPEQVADCNASHTGRALKPLLNNSEPNRLLQTKSN